MDPPAPSRYAIIDDFRQLAADIKRRGRRRRAGKWLVALAGLALPSAIAAAVLLGVPLRQLADDSIERSLAIPGTEDQSSDQDFELASADSMRDPILILDAAGSGGQYEIRFQNADSATAVNGKVFYVSERMGASAQLMTALPATPQDFALLSADSSAARMEPEAETLTAVVHDQNALTGDEAGWSGPAADGVPPDAGTSLPIEGATELAGSSSLAVLAPDMRPQGARELVVKVSAQRPVRAVLGDAGLAPAATEAAAGAAAALLNQQMLQPASTAVLLLDRAPDAAEPVLVQFMIIDNAGASAIRISQADGGYERIEDAQMSADISSYVDRTGNAAENTRYRLMDGLYAAGIRSGVPPTIMSEAVMQMARGYDLGQFMQAEDRFTLVYSDQPRDSQRESGHILYAAITTRGHTLACYVLKPGIDRDFTCMTEKDSITQQLGPVGFVTPVDGVLSSGFGPRMHPILKRVRVHQGIDWAAPPGTPIMSAFEGTVEFAGSNGAFGNFVRIKHPNGLATGYAHMSAFAQGLKVGQSVKAGELIGYVGTTGLSTGPHLHFELYVDGSPVDPLTFDGQVVADGSEKDKLVERIIQVESAGNPYARNPTSSATGLGQFLSGTWMRMIRSYRPDLASAMSEGELLSLRYDQTISREMLYNFAAENEADLRKAGLQATAGNLYLAHFLGSYGAISVLRAAPDEPLANVVGYQVIAANQFLSGKDAQWVVDWAARKMSGASTRLRRRLPPEIRIRNSRFAAYSGAIDRLLEAIEERRPG